MSQPFDQSAEVPYLGDLQEDRGEFWVGNPWDFARTKQNLSMYERNGVFLNAKDGSFFDVSFLSAADSKGDGRTAVGYDVTGDGMPELFVRQVGGGPLLVFRNNFPKAHWLKISLRGTQSNSFGIGAKIVADVQGKRIFREMYPIVNFLGQAPTVVHLGLADAQQVDRLEVRWPSGQVQEFTAVAGDQHVVIREGDATLKTVVPGQAKLRELAQRP